MAVYKVPQDVEADDKLIGPFSFRQFIYLIVVAISIAGAWGLSQVFIPLALIPLPVIVFFAALALPLRKDQPMEAYLSAVVSFYFLKSRKRLWQPDGIDSFVTIIPPKDSERILTKNFDEAEATKRLGYLADLVDTHGWAIRGAGGTPDTSINTDLYYESQQTVDMMDSSTPTAQALTQQLQQEASYKKQDAIAVMKATQKAAPANQATKAPAPATAQPEVKTEDNVAPASTLPSIEEVRAAHAKKAAEEKASKDAKDALAYANGLLEESGNKPNTTTATTAVAASEKPANTSVSTPDTATMELTQKQADELSQQADVTVATLAKEADRLAKQNRVLKDGDEVTISLH